MTRLRSSGIPAAQVLSRGITHHRADPVLVHALEVTRGIRDQDMQSRVWLAAYIESHAATVAALEAKLASIDRCPACQSEHDDAEADRWEDAREKNEQQCDEALDARRGL